MNRMKFENNECIDNIRNVYIDFYNQYEKEITPIISETLNKDVCSVITSMLIPVKITQKYIRDTSIVLFDVITDFPKNHKYDYNYTDIYLVIQNKRSLRNVGKNNFKILDASFCDIENIECYNNLKNIKLINCYYSTILSFPTFIHLETVYLQDAEYDFDNLKSLDSSKIKLYI